jgi:DNA-binding MarR family transcriptional regulator
VAARPAIGDDAVRALLRLSKQAESTLGEFQLSIAQYRVLDRLVGGHAAGKSLADWLAVRPPTVTVIVDGLVARGLVARELDPTDRRRVTHRLTDAGRTVFETASAAIAAKLNRVAAHAETPDDAHTMVAGLGLWNSALARAASAPAAGAIRS